MALNFVMLHPAIFFSFFNFTLNNTIISETEDKLKHYCEELVFIWEILCNLYKIIIVSRTLDINCEKNMLLSR